MSSLLIMNQVQGVPEKLDFRNLNKYDSYCLKQQFYGSKFGRNKWESFNMTWQLLILV